MCIACISPSHKYERHRFSLWELGASYLIYIGKQGHARLEAHIDRMRIEDEEMAERLFALCMQYSLDNAKEVVTRTMAFRYDV